MDEDTRHRDRIAELERALAEREVWFRTLLDGFSGALAVSIDGSIIETNRPTAELFGHAREELVGMTVAELTTAEGASEVLAHIRRGDETPYRVTGVRKGGATFPGEIHGRNVSFRGKPARLSFFRDLSDELQAKEQQARFEEQMRAAQKLEMLGLLAGGIAHDFNNLLQAILGYMELASLELGSGHASAKASAALDQARDAALRASEIVSQMLTYSGRSPRLVEQVSLSEVVRDIAELLLVSLSKNTEITLELPDGLPDACVDTTQLRQVIMNLVLNASEALGGRAGRVHVRVGERVLAEADVAELRLATPELPRDVVFLEVEDEGVGISEDELGKIFDPFYSTKFSGRGLGLASVAGIVRSHGGGIAVESTPGRGSRFTIYLPASTSPRRPPREPMPSEHPPAALSGHVLFADDEPLLLELLGNALGDAGAEVARAHDGREALELFTRSPDRWTAVVLDLTMPRMGGAEALREMRRLRADLPALLLSGYSETSVDEDVRAGPTRFLSKPFSFDSLVDALCRLLGER